MKISVISPLDKNERVYQNSFASKNKLDNNFDVFQKNKKEYCKEILYNVYSGRVDIETERYFNNPKNIKKLFNDPTFIKASISALREVLTEKAEETPDVAEKELLMSFATLLRDEEKHLVKDSIKKKERNRINTGILEPVFGFRLNPFNYGFFIKPDTREKKAEAIVNRYATMAAGESALLLQVSTKLETAVLTTNTIKMCHEICDTYQMPGGVASGLVAQMSGAFAGKALASWLSKGFFGIGNLANATITYALHEMQGRAIIEWCKKNYNNPNIENLDDVVRTLRILLPIAANAPSSLDNGGEDVW